MLLMLNLNMFSKNRKIPLHLRYCGMVQFIFYTDHIFNLVSCFHHNFYYPHLSTENKTIASEMHIPQIPDKQFLTPCDIEEVKQYKDQETFRAKSVSYVKV